MANLFASLAEQYEKDYDFRANTLESFIWFYEMNEDLRRDLKDILQRIYSKQNTSLWVRKIAIDCWAELESREIAFQDKERLYSVEYTDADINITNRCNSGCPFCYARLHPPKDMQASDAALIVHQLEDISSHKIIFTGGEPFLKRNVLMEVMYVCTSLSIRRIELFSNGFWGTTEDDARNVLEEVGKAIEGSDIKVSLNLNLRAKDAVNNIANILRAHNDLPVTLKERLHIIIENQLVDDNGELAVLLQSVSDLMRDKDTFFWMDDECPALLIAIKGPEGADFDDLWGFIFKDGTQYPIRPHYISVTHRNEGNLNMFKHRDIDFVRPALCEMTNQKYSRVQGYMMIACPQRDQAEKKARFFLVISSDKWASPGYSDIYGHPRLWNIEFTTIEEMVRAFERDPFWQIQMGESIEENIDRVKKLLVEEAVMPTAKVQDWISGLKQKHNTGGEFVAELTQDAYLRYLLRQQYAGNEVKVEYPGLIMPELCFSLGLSAKQSQAGLGRRLSGAYPHAAVGNVRSRPLAECNSRGFTLIELLVATVAIAVMAVSIATLGGEFTLLIFGIISCIVLGYSVLTGKMLLGNHKCHNLKTALVVMLNKLCTKMYAAFFRHTPSFSKFTPWVNLGTTLWAKNASAFFGLRRDSGILSETGGEKETEQGVIVHPAGDKKIPPVKVIFLDLDGVLFRSPTERYVVPARLLSQYGVNITAKQLETITHPGKEWIEEATKGCFPQQRLLDYVNKRLRPYGLQKDLTADEFFEMYFAPRTPNEKFYPLLKALKDKGVRFGILSGRWVGDTPAFRRKLHSAFPGIFKEDSLILFSRKLRLSKRASALYEFVK
ncbi:MAG: radical SAM protein, partial [Deltaproteobacteria bacterium]|nr:radical SAM protein [Deltaproteobacteria bacterium]